MINILKRVILKKQGKITIGAPSGCDRLQAYKMPFRDWKATDTLTSWVALPS